MGCCTTCLRMIVKHYGENYTLQSLRSHSYITSESVSLLDISDATESIGFRIMGVKVPFEKLEKENVTPFIAYWKQTILWWFIKHEYPFTHPSKSLIT